MTGVWINTDLMSFMKVPGEWMKVFGITYFQDTVKDTQMENCCSKSIQMCPYHYLLIPHQEQWNNITPLLLHVQVKAGNEDDFV